MYKLLAYYMPRKLALLAFERMVNHCLKSNDQEIVNDARYTDNTKVQWQKLIDSNGKEHENR